jgi:proteic killer suppression protein
MSGATSKSPKDAERPASAPRTPIQIQLSLDMPLMAPSEAASLLPRLARGTSGLVPYRTAIYNTLMIQSFKCSDTGALHQRRRVERWVNIEAVARRKLDQLDAAGELRDMASPPGNRLEALSGNRKRQHSIRINDQFRVCFVWTPQGPKDLEIVDDH